MIKETYGNMVRYNIAKERTQEEHKLLTRKIGGTGSYSWSNKPFELSVMQMAIIDLLYDAGKDRTYSPKQMLNRKTREAYVLDRDWTVGSIKNRKQTSCGHDEVEYNMYTLYDYDPKTSEKTTVYQGKQGEKYADLDELEAAAKALMDIHVALEGNIDWKYHYSDESTCKGKCGWEDLRHPETKLPCKHHRSAVSEAVVVNYKHRETGHIMQSLYTTSSYYNRPIDDADSYDMVIWDEQDHTEFLKGVDDGEVLLAIKYAIRQMRTESRPWLESNYEDYNYETKAWEYKGKRGHYRLTWWSSIAAEERTDAVTEANIAKEGEVINGWTFTTSKSHYHNGRQVVNGDWQGTVTVYGVKGSEYYDRDTVFTQEIHWRTEEEAQVLCQMLNSRARVASHYHDYLPKNKAVVYEVEKVVRLDDNFVSMCTDYTPKQYYKLCHEGLITASSNKECVHTYTGNTGSEKV